MNSLDVAVLENDSQFERCYNDVFEIDIYELNLVSS